MLQVAPSTYYDAVARRPSARDVSDAAVGVEVLRVFDDNFGVYGAEKVWRQLRREGIDAGRDRVARLMRALGTRGVRRAHTARTTVPAKAPDRPGDLVKRDFTARRRTGCGWPT